MVDLSELRCSPFYPQALQVILLLEKPLRNVLNRQHAEYRKPPAQRAWNIHSYSPIQVHQIGDSTQSSNPVCAEDYMVEFWVHEETHRHRQMLKEQIASGQLIGDDVKIVNTCLYVMPSKEGMFRLKSTFDDYSPNAVELRCLQDDELADSLFRAVEYLEWVDDMRRKYGQRVDYSSPSVVTSSSLTT